MRSLSYWLQADIGKPISGLYLCFVTSLIAKQVYDAIKVSVIIMLVMLLALINPGGGVYLDYNLTGACDRHPENPTHFQGFFYHKTATHVQGSPVNNHTHL